MVSLFFSPNQEGETLFYREMDSFSCQFPMWDCLSQMKKPQSLQILRVYSILITIVTDGGKEMGLLSHSPSPKEWCAQCNTQAPPCQPKVKIRLARPKG